MTHVVKRTRDEKRRSWAAWRNFSTAGNGDRYRLDRNRLKAVISWARADVRLSNNVSQENRRFFAQLNHFRIARKSTQRIKKVDGSDTMDQNEIAELFSGAFRNDNKAVDHHPEPRVEARQLVTQMAALMFTPEAFRSVLEGVTPHTSAGPDCVYPSLVGIEVDV